MDQKTMTLKCFRCSKQQLLLDMVMDASGRGMVCRTCAGLPPKGSKVAVVTRPSVREQFARPKTPSSSKGKYACANCKYRFTSSKPLAELACPYCGARRISTMDEMSADSLLRDASKREYDF